MALYDRIVNPSLLVRRISLTAARVVNEAAEVSFGAAEQLDLFIDYAALERHQAEEKAALALEQKVQQAVLRIKKRYGKNAILKGMNLQEDTTAVERNKQIGGHKV